MKIKKLYKIASLLLAWGLPMNTAAFAANDVPATVSNNMDASSDTPVVPDNLSQLPALEAYNALYSTFEMDETGDYIFPDEYGGPVFLAYSSGHGALGTVAATIATGEMMYSALRYAINAGFSLKTS